MTRVYCYNDDCIHCDADTKICACACISVGENESYGCNEYQCYLDTEEYGEDFYALVGKRGKVIGREKRKGKKIEYNGRIFYAREKVTENPNTWVNVTDAKTGLLVRLYYVKDHWDKFIELADKQPDIESFPLVEMGEDGNYHVI